MGLHEISSKDAVLKAIAEFDELGRPAFLAKYGFAESRDVFLVHDEKQYDSKPILAAAHQFQLGQPLERFHGGQPTIQKLTELGFEVGRAADLTAGIGNPWSRDERLLVLSLFFEAPRSSAARAELAALLMRTPDAVSFELAIFKGLSNPGKGLGKPTQVAIDLWAQFSNDPAGLKLAADAARERIDAIRRAAGIDLQRPRRYWVGGHGSPERLEEFLAQKTWRIDWAKDATERAAVAGWRLFGDVRVGDLVAIKGFGGRNDLVIHAVGIVESVDENEGSLRWAPTKTTLFRGKAAWKPGNGNWFQTLCEVTEAEPLREIFGIGAAAEDQISMTTTNIYDFLQSKGLHFPRELVASYLLSLKTKPFVILSGISGTGKTKLAEYVAEWAGTEKRQVAAPPSLPPTKRVWQYVLSPYTFSHRKIVVAREFEDEFELTEFGSRPATIEFGGSQFKGTVGKVRSKGRELHELRLGVPLTDLLEKDAKLGDVLEIEGDRYLGDGLIRIKHVPVVPKTIEQTFVRHAFVSVRPDWLDNKGVLGFYNLLTERFAPTPFLRQLVEAYADEPEGLPHFITLDEMNLARVEHYFSDLLSALETRKLDGDTTVVQEGIDLHNQTKCEPLVELEDDVRPTACTNCKVTAKEMRACGLHPDGIPMAPPKLPVPTNVFITGTVNVDETTHAFSPKVLDRSNVIEFNTVNLDEIPGEDGSPLVLKNGTITLSGVKPAGLDHFNNLDSGTKTRLRALLALLEPFHLHFGYRVANEIGLWIQNAREAVGDGQAVRDAALDIQVLQKILPKLNGTKQKLQQPLSKLLHFACDLPTDRGAVSAEALKLFDDSLTQKDPKAPDFETKKPGTKTPSMPRSAKKLVRMLKRLNEQGFVSFIE